MADLVLSGQWICSTACVAAATAPYRRARAPLFFRNREEIESKAIGMACYGIRLSWSGLQDRSSSVCRHFDIFITNEIMKDGANDARRRMPIRTPSCDSADGNTGVNRSSRSMRKKLYSFR